MNHFRMIFMILLTISIVTILITSHQSTTAYGKTAKDDNSKTQSTSTSDKKFKETKVSFNPFSKDGGGIDGNFMKHRGDFIGNQQKSNKDNGENTIPIIVDDNTKAKTTEDKTKVTTKDTSQDNTDKSTKNNTSGSSVDSSKGSSDTGNNNSTSKGGGGGNTTTTGQGGKPVVTNDTKPIPDPYGPCGPAMILDKTGKCILDKNCEYKDVNQTIISCYNVKTRHIVVHENTNNNYNSHSSSNSKTTINNNNNYVTNNPTTLLSNNIFRTTALNTAILQPENLLLLDSKQLLDIVGDTNDSAIQSLFCTTSFKTVYSAQTRSWFITGMVQNINTLGQPTSLSNIQVHASFFDSSGNPISTIQNITLEPNTLAHDEQGRFTFTVGLDTDLLGVMPTFIVISYNIT